MHVCADCDVKIHSHHHAIIQALCIHIARSTEMKIERSERIVDIRWKKGVSREKRNRLLYKTFAAQKNTAIKVFEYFICDLCG